MNTKLSKNLNITAKEQISSKFYYSNKNNKNNKNNKKILHFIDGKLFSGLY